MPELTIPRDAPDPPPVCMYCGAPAGVVREWREVNRPARPIDDPGNALPAAPAADDPVSGVLAVLLLPFALWELVKGLAAAAGAVAGYAARGRNTSAEPEPADEPPTTRVVVTACDRHRDFGARFRWAWVGVLAILVVLWAWAVAETRRAMGTEDAGLAVGLVVAAIFATILLPMAVGGWRMFAGPVGVERVTDDAVVLGRVRPAYFEATGRRPGG